MIHRDAGQKTAGGADESISGGAGCSIMRLKCASADDNICTTVRLIPTFKYAVIR